MSIKRGTQTKIRFDRGEWEALFSIIFSNRVMLNNLFLGTFLCLPLNVLAFNLMIMMMISLKNSSGLMNWWNLRYNWKMVGFLRDFSSSFYSKKYITNPQVISSSVIVIVWKISYLLISIISFSTSFNKNFMLKEREHFSFKIYCKSFSTVLPSHTLIAESCSRKVPKMNSIFSQTYFLCTTPFSSSFDSVHSTSTR